jgi:GDPmannose 4,6-dehydratase
MRRALITGITGQDGSYLAELLLEKGYKVFGLVRPCSQPRMDNIAHLLDRITILSGNLIDQGSLIRAIEDSGAHEVYNLAAQSFVPDSFREPEATFAVNAAGVVRLLEAIRGIDISIRFYQASTSEMFGNGSGTGKLNELSRFYPRSPYGAAKVAAHHAVVNYRETYGMFACCGILFNHESPRRGHMFVTRFVSRAVAEIKAGKRGKLPMGNMDAVRDWGHARDYVRAMWMMMQQEDPDDYVIGTGVTHTVKDVTDAAFFRAGLDPDEHIVIDPKYLRPADVNHLCADPIKAKIKLNWKPEISFESLICEMVDHDMGLLGLK